MEEESEEGSCSNTSTTTNVAENLPSLKGPSVCYTPRGTKEFIPCCPPELKPTIGMPFDSLLKGFEFYKQYARFCGFVVRLGTEKRTQATDEVYLKYLYCNKQGFTKDGETKGRVAKKEGKPKARKRTINRVGCSATIKEEEGIEQYRIVDNTRKKSYHFTYVLCSNDASCSCRMFESVGILCRYILFVMKGKFLFEIPRQYVLHRWTKEAMKKPIFGLNNNLLDGAQKDKKQKLVGDLWYRFFSCVSLCEEKVECLESLLSKLISFENEMKDLESEGPVDKREAKNKHIELFVGSNDIVVDILPPNKSSNKGSGSGKRKKSDKEIAIEESQKKDRLCRTCGQRTNHDSRNCPQKKKKPN
uniref:Zinc finger PMZ-type domain-containing protein n=1 Tax=Chenopodium quinoa TaxID=63459 RepID=A0A803N6R6_CHEQI